MFEARISQAEADTVWWLQRQLAELDRWRHEILIGDPPSSIALEKLDAHRAWLEHQLEILSYQQRVPNERL